MQQLNIDQERERKQKVYARIDELINPLYRHFNAYDNEGEKAYNPIQYIYTQILNHIKGNTSELPKNVYIIKTKSEAIKKANITSNLYIEVEVIDEKGIPANEYTKNKYWIEIPWRDAKIYKINKKQEATLIPGTVEYTLLNPYWKCSQNIKRIIIPKGY